MKIYTPQVFQGSLKKKNYFEGWYFKHVSKDLKHVLAFIPGIALTKNNKHAFIQIINGITGQTHVVNYPIDAFNFKKNEFNVTVGNSNFTQNKIELNIDEHDLKIEGELSYLNIVSYPSTLFSPGIMGWYSFVPFMECKHGIGSMLHNLSGKIEFNNEIINFDNGTGYIEKDWGTSFPESWIWLHCNTFDIPDCSFTFSVAKIPWLGSFFIGHICFLYVNGEFHLFATYNKSKITHLGFHDPILEIEMINRTHRLKVRAKQNGSGNLKAPVTGEMSRIIKESVDSEIEITLMNKKSEKQVSLTGSRAGLEIMEKILTYF